MLKNKVVIFDLDGTLLNSDNEIIGGIETLECLDTLRQKGCTLAICTGRLDHDIVKIEQKYQLDIRHRISQNGAVIIKDDLCESILLDKEEALQIYNYIKNEDIRIELNTVSNRYWNSERDPLFPKEFYDSHIIKDNYEEIITCQPAVLFLLVGQQQKLSQIENYVNTNYQNTKAVMTSATSLEILNIKASKGSAVEKLYPDYEIYTIGDSPNDYDMFPVSKQGYLVSEKPCLVECIRKPNILEALQDIVINID